MNKWTVVEYFAGDLFSRVFYYHDFKVSNYISVAKAIVDTPHFVVLLYDSGAWRVWMWND